MLQKLSIRNYALIDQLDIEFDNQLNIVTGETGAGKSIILGALSLILGQRAESKYFFNQDKKCVIEGVFHLVDTTLASLFEENDIDFYPESILRREISIDGKSRAFINDTPVNLAILKQIGEKLIDIHSQHATLEINDTDFQLLVVDVMAGHAKLLNQYRSGFRKLKQDSAALASLIGQAEELRNRNDYEQFLFNELEQANLQKDEQEQFEQELEALSHAESIKRNLYNTSQLLADSGSAALPVLKEAVTQLQSIEKYSPDIFNLNERLRSAIIEIKDIADETIRIEDKTLHNAERLSYIQERLDLIYNLQQKHKVGTIDDLLKVQEKLADSLSKLTSFDEEIEQLKQSIETLKTDLKQNAEVLSNNRKEAILLAESQITQKLQLLGMPNARMSFAQDISGGLNKDGQDSLTLLFSANSGQALAPVSKVASGGELSRLMLAIKSLIAKHTSLPTIIFDEIDTGISGETAVKVGQVITDLGDDMQVICITHLPQIAAKGSAHYFVYKNEAGEKTTTGIRKLNRNERVHAIAEMLSGKKPGESALQNARELLES